MSLYSRFTRSDAELNLIPLIDIMSVMVAFLLIYSADVEIVQNTKGVEIPQSTAEAQPKHSVTVMITKDHLFVQGEVVAKVADIRGEEEFVEALRQVLERPMLVQNAPTDDMSKREITVIADKTLPFEVVQKVMATCTASEYGTISLAVLGKEKSANAS